MYDEEGRGGGAGPYPIEDVIAGGEHLLNEQRRDNLQDLCALNEELGKVGQLRC